MKKKPEVEGSKNLIDSNEKKSPCFKCERCNTFPRGRFFLNRVSTKSHGSSTTTSNAEVMLFQTDMCEVIDHVIFFYVLDHKKVCES